MIIELPSGECEFCKEQGYRAELVIKPDQRDCPRCGVFWRWYIGQPTAMRRLDGREIRAIRNGTVVPFQQRFIVPGIAGLCKIIESKEADK